MKIKRAVLACWIWVLPLLSVAAPLKGPVIADFGPYYPVPEAGFPTVPEQDYRAVFDVAKVPDEAGRVNPRIETLARFLNMHAQAGVPGERLAAALVVHGPAAANLLTDQAHRSRFGASNPNTELLAALQEAGVEVIICGQTAAFGGYGREDFLPGVKVALSAMTALVSLQNRGYALIAF